MSLPADLNYPTPAGETDEVGPHWQPFFDAIGTLGRAELTRRWHDAQHVLRENGVTYNVYHDPTGLNRAWKLDPVPLVIDKSDAQLLARGLAQRAQLLELILDDLYGPQQLLKDRRLPAELVFGNPGFLRPMVNVQPPKGRRLLLTAANLGRAADGTWRVLADRTQAPSGAGYALENRIVTARTLPEAFRDCQVDRLAVFFGTLRDQLAALAPAHRGRPGGNPRIVLLTPGPYNETYFEHAYLARYLGFTLVEGGDLTVRADRVYLKVLGGLQPVDVIFRRLDDDYCDPLELRSDSYLGIPGLVNAIRSQTVAVANALGAGVLESPAVQAYLPALCRFFLSEDLIIPGARAWWLGDPAARTEALADLNAVVVKPRFLSARLEPVVIGELPAETRRFWLDQIAARPADYVAQERLPLSTVPVLMNGELVPRKCVLRGYVAAAADGGYTVMPGGLTRVSGTPHAAVVTMQGGGGSKDTWFLAAGPVSQYTLLPPTDLPVELTRAGGDLPSRAADNLFWLGRYAERADSLARLLRGVVIRLTEQTGLADAPELAALTNTLRRMAGSGRDSLEADVIALAADLDRPCGLPDALFQLKRVASAVRDRMSIDMWRAVSDVCQLPTEARLHASHDGLTLSNTLDLLNRTILSLAAFTGLAAEGMTRTEAWRFLDIGRRVERAVTLLNLLIGTLGDPVDPEAPVLEAVLEVADASMTYRRRYLGSLRADAVLDLLILDDTNPRSLASQLEALSTSIDQLPRSKRSAGLGPDQRAALDVWNRVRLAAVERLAAVTPAGRQGLKDMARDLTAALPVLSDLLTDQFLTHQPASRHLGMQASPAPADQTGS